MVFGCRPILGLKSKISHEQNVIYFQFYIRLPNFRLLGSIIKIKSPSRSIPLSILYRLFFETQGRKHGRNLIKLVMVHRHLKSRLCFIVVPNCKLPGLTFEVAVNWGAEMWGALWEIRWKMFSFLWQSWFSNLVIEDSYQQRMDLSLRVPKMIFGNRFTINHLIGLHVTINLIGLHVTIKIYRDS